MKNYRSMLYGYLPAMVIVALLAYVFLGAFPGALLTGDFIAAIAQLPVITIYAFGAIGVTYLYCHHTFLDLDNTTERMLRDMVISGAAGAGRWAFWLLVLDFVRRFLPLVAFLIFFFLPR